MPIVLHNLFLPRIHAVCVCDQAEYFYEHIDDQLKQYNLLDSEGKQLRAVDIVDIIDGYKGTGYSLSTKEELGMILKTTNSTVRYHGSLCSSVDRHLKTHWNNC